MKKLICTVAVLAVSTAQAGVCGDPDAGDCCAANGTPGCVDADCCQAVCAINPFCCDVNWGMACVLQARELCASLCPCPNDVFAVPGEFPTIQSAIFVACSGTEIVVAPGTYYESINFDGKAIWLHSSDGPEVTIIDAQQTGRVVTCWSGEGPDTVLDGFTITGGNAIFGGGMYNSGSSPTVINCTFIGNSAYNGGGMSNLFDSSPTVIHCSFSGNTATTRGGGMYNHGSSAKVTACTFSGNSALLGGGMRNAYDNSTVTNCTFSGNTAYSGGGMRNSLAASPTVTNCTFSGNTAEYSGGGIGISHNSSPTVTNCTFGENTAFRGGAMSISSSSSPAVTNCTFIGNSAANGEALAFDFGPSALTMANCIMWDGGSEIWNNDGSNLSITYSNVQGGFPGIRNIDADPLFVDPDNGDYRLSPGSPGIDAGDNTAVPEGIITDLDGNPRFVDDPGTSDTGNGDPPIVDMGAYEFQGTPCPWDLDGDGNVFVTDLLLLLGDFGSCNGSPADFDGDGCVGIMDLLTLIANFGPCSMECVDHAGCDDDNPCTIDLCIGGNCYHVPIGGPNCGG